MAMLRSLGSSRLTTRSPIRIVPALTSSSPATMRSKVDLPQPDGPSTTRSSPSAIPVEIPLITSVWPNSLRTSSRTTSAIGSPPHFSVSIRPLTNQRCISTTTATGGSIASIATAIT